MRTTVNTVGYSYYMNLYLSICCTVFTNRQITLNIRRDLHSIHIQSHRLSTHTGTRAREGKSG